MSDRKTAEDIKKEMERLKEQYKDAKPTLKETMKAKGQVAKKKLGNWWSKWKTNRKQNWENLKERKDNFIHAQMRVKELEKEVKELKEALIDMTENDDDIS